MPVYTSLYTDCKEIDVSASHLSSTSQDAARGTLALSISAEGSTQPLPRTLHGAIALQTGQTVEFLDHNAQNSVHALEVLNGLMIGTAAGYSVPDYMIHPDDSAISKESGTALMVKTEPLKKMHNHRVQLNSPQIDKLHKIDVAYIYLYAKDDDATKELLRNTTQVWDAGDITIPESRKDKTERLAAAKALGVVDEIAAIRDYYNLASDEEAVKVYEQMRDRAEEFPPLSKPEEPVQPRALGLPRRNVVQ